MKADDFGSEYHHKVHILGLELNISSYWMDCHEHYLEHSFMCSFGYD